jgi:hypothetical protein
VTINGQVSDNGLACRTLTMPPSGMSFVSFVRLIDWIAAFVVTFDVLLLVLLKTTMRPDAVIFPGGGSGPPPTSELGLLLGLLWLGVLLWPCAAWLAIRLLITAFRRVTARAGSTGNGATSALYNRSDDSG